MRNFACNVKIRSSTVKTGKVDITLEKPLEIPAKYFGIIDWHSIYLEIINYKIARGMFNLLIDIDTLKQIVTSRKYQIFMSESLGIKIENNGKPFLKIKSFEVLKHYMR